MRRGQCGKDNLSQIEENTEIIVDRKKRTDHITLNATGYRPQRPCTQAARATETPHVKPSEIFDKTHRKSRSSHVSTRCSARNPVRNLSSGF